VGQRFDSSRVFYKFDPNLQPIGRVHPGEEEVVLETRDCFSNQISDESQKLASIDFSPTIIVALITALPCLPADPEGPLLRGQLRGPERICCYAHSSGLPLHKTGKENAAIACSVRGLPHYSSDLVRPRHTCQRAWLRLACCGNSLSGLHHERIQGQNCYTDRVIFPFC